MANKIKLRRGAIANLPTLDVGEPAFTTDTKELYIGSISGNILIGVKVDGDTIKLNMSNQAYVDAIAMSKVTGLATALGLKVDDTRTINGKSLENDVTLVGADIIVDDELSKFDGMNLQAIAEQIDNDIPKISTNIVNDELLDTKAASPKAVKTYVDTRLSTTYKASGTLTAAGIVNGLLIVGNVGNVYNVSEAFTTTAKFLEGAGKTYPAGTNIVVIVGDGEYLFDVLTGFIDTSSFLTNVPIATDSVVGGIKANAKGGGDTVEVKIDGSTGKAYVPTYPTVTDTKNTAGTTQKATTKLFIVGAESQGANPQTFSNDKVYIGTDGKLYSNGAVVLTDIPQATTGAFGGIKVNYSTVTPKHKVELDGNGNAFVDLTNLNLDGGEW